MFNEDFPDDQSAFVDAFRNGMFHEHEPDWPGIAKSLSYEQLVNLGLSVIRPVVTGMGQREGDVDSAMRFYDALNKWTQNHLRSEKEILEPLKEFRDTVLRRASEVKSSWWVETVHTLMLVDLGIQCRMGIWSHEVSGPYEQMLAAAASH